MTGMSRYLFLVEVVTIDGRRIVLDATKEAPSPLAAYLPRAQGWADSLRAFQDDTSMSGGETAGRAGAV
jgi:hypothetical protein